MSVTHAETLFKSTAKQITAMTHQQSVVVTLLRAGRSVGASGMNELLGENFLCEDTPSKDTRGALLVGRHTIGIPCRLPNRTWQPHHCSNAEASKCELPRPPLPHLVSLRFDKVRRTHQHVIVVLIVAIVASRHHDQRHGDHRIRRVHTPMRRQRVSVTRAHTVHLSQRRQAK